MKKMKRLAALFLAVVMVMAMGMTAFAEEPATPPTAGNAKITIDNPVKGETYTLYKLFNVSAERDENGKVTGNAYSYYLTKADYDTYGTTLKAANIEFKESVDGSTYTVSKINGKELRELKDSDMAELASKLNTMMQEKDSEYTFNDTGKSVTATVSVVGEGEDAQEVVNPVVFDGLAPGYYFVDSSLGSLCALHTSADEVTMHEKNSTPSIKKEVEEDSDGSWGEEATADITQTVKFHLTVNTGTNTNAPDPTNPETGVDADYVIEDTLPGGMTYIHPENKISDGVSIVQIKDTKTKEAIAIPEGLVESVTYASDVLTITLDGEKIKDLGQRKDIVIEYSAKVDADAKIYNEVNKNTAILKYHDREMGKAEALVKTYEIGADDENGNGTLTKIDPDKDGENKGLEGVKFTLTNADGARARVDGVIFNGWISAPGEDASEDEKATYAAAKISTDSNGEIHVKGLDAGTYTLTETDPLPGYNPLDYTITIIIDEKNEHVVTYTENTDRDGAAENAPELDIVNNKGVILPSTGGIGTTIFYVVGGILVVGAGVLLITKKRMSAREK